MTTQLRIGVVGVGAIALRGILPHLTQDDVRDKVANSRALRPRGRARPGGGRAIRRSRGPTSTSTSCSRRGDRRRHDRLADRASPRALPARARGRQARARRTRRCARPSPRPTSSSSSRGRGLGIVAVAGRGAPPAAAPDARADRRRRDRRARLGDLRRLASAATTRQDEPERLTRPVAARSIPPWYFRKPGGGPMYDMTVYSLHQLTSVLGPARSSHRAFRRSRSASGVPRQRRSRPKPTTTPSSSSTSARAASRSSHGTAAGSISDQFGAGVYFGTRGTIDGVSSTASRSTSRARGDRRRARHRLGGADARPPARDRTAPRYPESHVFEDIMQLVGLVRDGTPTPVTAEHARHVIDIIESGYRAAETGETQDAPHEFALTRRERQRALSSSDPSFWSAPTGKAFALLRDRIRSAGRTSPRRSGPRRTRLLGRRPARRRAVASRATELFISGRAPSCSTSRSTSPAPTAAWSTWTPLSTRRCRRTSTSPSRTASRRTLADASGRPPA